MDSNNRNGASMGLVPRLLIGALAPLLLVQTSVGDEPKQQKQGGPPPDWRLISPELHPARKVTFRVYAPKASKVQLEAFDMFDEHQQLSRGDDGIWSITVDPVRPDIYTYKFLVDGSTWLEHRTTLPRRAALWGTGCHDLFAVGDNGAILHRGSEPALE